MIYNNDGGFAPKYQNVLHALAVEFVDYNVEVDKFCEALMRVPADFWYYNKKEKHHIIKKLLEKPTAQQHIDRIIGLCDKKCWLEDGDVIIQLMKSPYWRNAADAYINYSDMHPTLRMRQRWLHDAFIKNLCRVPADKVKVAAINEMLDIKLYADPASFTPKLILKSADRLNKLGYDFIDIELYVDTLARFCNIPWYASKKKFMAYILIEDAKKFREDMRLDGI